MELAYTTKALKVRSEGQFVQQKSLDRQLDSRMGISYIVMVNTKVRTVLTLVSTAISQVIITIYRVSSLPI